MSIDIKFLKYYATIRVAMKTGKKSQPPVEAPASIFAYSTLYLKYIYKV